MSANVGYKKIDPFADTETREKQTGSAAGRRYKKIDPFADTETLAVYNAGTIVFFATKKSIRLRILKHLPYPIVQCPAGSCYKKIDPFADTETYRVGVR